MNEIKIRRLSENGLTTHEYIFDIVPYTFNLAYSSYFIYHRDEDGLFSFDDPRFTHELLSYKEWCFKNNLPYEYDKYEEEYSYYPIPYEEYVDSRNPILHKTKNGRPLKGGISASIKNLPKCPKDVAEEALELARRKLVVKYE